MDLISTAVMREFKDYMFGSLHRTAISHRQVFWVPPVHHLGIKLVGEYECVDLGQNFREIERLDCFSGPDITTR